MVNEYSEKLEHGPRFPGVYLLGVTKGSKGISGTRFLEPFFPLYTTQTDVS
jgi:hypothetical protein